MLAHRAAYFFTHGSIPEGLQINHHCDVPACCNPRHLYAGTHAENMRDAVERNRHVGRPRLFDDEAVRAIRDSPLSGVALARDLGCDQSTISLIRARKTYEHVV